jgi:sec-independent protein translocase protein TatA
MPFGLTPAHLIIILVIVLIVVGPGKLPDTGAAIGKALRGFKNEMDGTNPDQAAASLPPAPPVQQVQPPVQYVQVQPPVQYVPVQPQVQYAPQQVAPVYQQPVPAAPSVPAAGAPAMPEQQSTPPTEPPSQG